MPYMFGLLLCCEGFKQVPSDEVWKFRVILCDCQVFDTHGHDVMKEVSPLGILSRKKFIAQLYYCCNP